MTHRFQRKRNEWLAIRMPTPQVDTVGRSCSLAAKAQSPQRNLGNSYLQRMGEGQRKGDAPGLGYGWKKQPGATATAGGLSGLTLDVTFSVTGQSATGLQVIQTVWTTRGDKQIGTMTFSENSKTYDAFVDGGKLSPYVTEAGNDPAHPTKPFYLTADEVKNQVKFTKDTGSVRIYDVPTAVAVHDEAYFETAVVALNHNNSGTDKVLQAFDWGWTGKGTVPTVAKGTEVAGKDSGLNIKNSVSPRFTSIVKHDYPDYTFT